jgi:hypothetical protein
LRFSISKGHFIDSRSARFQRPIGIDWSIFEIFRESGVTSLGSKKTVSDGEVRARP